MTTKRKWLVTLGLLHIGDVVLTPWHDLGLEANPLIRNYGMLPMLAFKVVGIWLFTVGWNFWDNKWFRRWAVAVSGLPVAFAVVWNCYVMWRLK